MNLCAGPWLQALCAHPWLLSHPAWWPGTSWASWWPYPCIFPSSFPEGASSAPASWVCFILAVCPAQWCCLFRSLLLWTKHQASSVLEKCLAGNCKWTVIIRIKDTLFNALEYQAEKNRLQWEISELFLVHGAISMDHPLLKLIYTSSHDW